MSFASPSFRPRVEALEGRLLLAGVELVHGDDHVDTPDHTPAETPSDAPDASGVELPTVTVTVEQHETCDVLVVCVRSAQPTQHVSVDGGEGEWTDFNGFARIPVPFDTLVVELQITDLRGVELPVLRIVFDVHGRVLEQTWNTDEGVSTNYSPLDPTVASHGHELGASGGGITSAMDRMTHAEAVPVAYAHEANAAGVHESWERRGASQHAMSLGSLELTPQRKGERDAGHGPAMRGGELEAAPSGGERTAGAAEAIDDQASDAALVGDWAGGTWESGELEAAGVLDVLASRWTPSAATQPSGDAEDSAAREVTRFVPPAAPAPAKPTETVEDEGEAHDPWSVAALVAVAAATGTAAVVVERRAKRADEATREASRQNGAQ